MEFNYVVQRQEKTKVCFGSGLERQTLESDKKGMVSKHARHYLKEINERTSPVSYDHAKKKSATSDLLNKPTSNRGTILGGRTASRKFFEVTTTTPGPGAYDIPSPFDKEYKQTCAPFNSKVERSMYKYPNVPGVGIYNVSLYKRRRIAFAHTFGGKKCLFPAVKMKCGPFNFDTCQRCEKRPEGDYWYLDTVQAENLSEAMKQKLSESEGIFLCRPCYEIEKKENKIFSKGQIRVFKINAECSLNTQRFVPSSCFVMRTCFGKTHELMHTTNKKRFIDCVYCFLTKPKQPPYMKIRDCSKVHFHDGCKAKLFLVSPQEIEKVKLREGYLSLYFS